MKQKPLPPSLSDIERAIALRWRERQHSHAAHAWPRRLLVIAFILILGLLGPYLVAASIFPGARTAVEVGTPPNRCVYDAAPMIPIGRLDPPPAPSPMVTGTLSSMPISIRNTGTCDWDSRVGLRREGGSLADQPAVISATFVASRAGSLIVQVPVTVPQQIGTFDSAWRLVTPGGAPFGPLFRFSIITYREGPLPSAPPPPSPFAAYGLFAFLVMAVPAFLGLAAAAARGGQFMQHFYGLKTRLHGRDHLLRLTFNMIGKKPSARAEEGEYNPGDDNEAIDKVGGPGSLLVGRNMIALLECSGRFSRIVGPGHYHLFPFERVRAVIDARQMRRSKTENAPTKDGIEVKIETWLSFRIVSPMDDEMLPEPQPRESVSRLIRAWLGLKVPPGPPPVEIPASPEAVRRTVYEWYVYPDGTPWDKTVSSRLSDEIPRRMLDDLWAIDDPSRKPRREIVEELTAKQRESLRKRGIDLIEINIDPIIVPPEVDALRRKWWQAYWKKDNRLTEADGDAEALTIREEARIDAQERMIRTLARSLQDLGSLSTSRLSEIIALRFIDAMEAIAGVWLTDGSRADYMALLEYLHRMLSASRTLVDTAHASVDNLPVKPTSADSLLAEHAAVDIPIPLRLTLPVPAPSSVRFFSSTDLPQSASLHDYRDVDRASIYDSEYAVHLLRPDPLAGHALRLHVDRRYDPFPIASRHDRRDLDQAFILMRRQERPDRPDQEVVVVDAGQRHIWVSRDHPANSPIIIGDNLPRQWLYCDEVGNVSHKEGRMIGVVEALLLLSGQTHA